MSSINYSPDSSLCGQIPIMAVNGYCPLPIRLRQGMIISVAELQKRPISCICNSDIEDCHKFLTCEVVHTMKPYPFNCTHNTNEVSKPVPAPRLVCVETNPGPTPTVLKLMPPISGGVLVTNGGGNRKRKRKGKGRKGRNRKRQRRSRPSSGVSSSAVDYYIRSLRDPWEYGPVKLGYDTFVPTETGAAFLRSSITVNIDGTFAIAVTPQASASFVTTWTGGHAAAATSSLASTNAAQILSEFKTGRCVSGGIRVFALFPATVQPGILFGGELVEISLTSLNAFTPDQLNAIASDELGFGSRGARAIIKPIDNTSFEFITQLPAGYGASTLMQSSIPFISGTGFTAGTVIWYEAVLNFEGIPNNTGTTLGVSVDESIGGGSVMDFFATPAHLLRSVAQSIGPAVVMDAVEGLASMVSPGLGSTISSVRSLFGRGKNYSNSMASGRNSIRQGVSSSIMIEEMKE